MKIKCKIDKSVIFYPKNFICNYSEIFKSLKFIIISSIINSDGGGTFLITIDWLSIEMLSFSGPYQKVPLKCIYFKVISFFCHLLPGQWHNTICYFIAFCYCKQQLMKLKRNPQSPDHFVQFLLENHSILRHIQELWL